MIRKQLCQSRCVKLCFEKFEYLLAQLFQNKTAIIGQRTQLSEGDILRVNRMYDCKMQPETTTKVPETTTKVPKPDKPSKPAMVKEALANFISSLLKGIFSKEN